MANDINLTSGNGITIDLNLSDKSLSIEINSKQLDTLIATLLNNKNSAVYKKLKSILESTDITVGKVASHTHTVANITDLKYGPGNKSGTIFIKY